MTQKKRNFSYQVVIDELHEVMEEEGFLGEFEGLSGGLLEVVSRWVGVAPDKKTAFEAISSVVQQTQWGIIPAVRLWNR